MARRPDPFPTSNQHPEKEARLARGLRRLLSYAPRCKLIHSPDRPRGISVMTRVRNERDWVRLSLSSIRNVADEIIVVDNGSTDGTHEIVQKMAADRGSKIALWREPDLDLCGLSNFALERTRFSWVFRWDADFVAHTSGPSDIARLRERLLALDGRRYYLIYLRLINLAGDLRHQDAREMVHIEEYIHTYSGEASFVHQGQFEAVRFPKHYLPLFWYEPYAFHVNIKPARRMLLRHFLDEWLALNDYERYPRVDDLAVQRIEKEFATRDMDEAQQRLMSATFRHYIRYDPGLFGPYPELLRPHLERQRYKLRFSAGRISGRDE